MDKVKFRYLLTDLYNIYNPANIQYIDDLVERYNRLEFDALKNIFIKYNRKGAAYYDTEIGTDKYILDLIKEYESGLRSLENINLKEQGDEKNDSIEKQQEEKDLKKIEEIQKEVKEEVTTEVYKKIEESLKTKIDEFKKLSEDIYKKITNDNDITIRIFSAQSNSELDLPNKKLIASLGKGARIIVKDAEGKTMGLEIIDVTYDTISDVGGKPLVEIFLDKA